MQLEHNTVEVKLWIFAKTHKEEISMTHFHKFADELTKFFTLTSLWRALNSSLLDNMYPSPKPTKYGGIRQYGFS